ncbi:MAG: hypothetical protein A2821_03680 [Candidatus Magasanikbacteria bacterium RIFCSPHIGHO2_01_FULL_41_23]|uniref:Transcription regulator TrmB N-terminal domain-containing protein n=1 Tax=Candidatus Magasanikbacteria bacterium RIFCSPLOWO2_01_FULL_40_15 TaxID=1798686 RepID=A0A1F6N4J7_9BACT|nr:MAG: hypothetical protein A2821_03680 [Candidatus Magasanikbacteria bacterium RIFCSPHIGHO2_01_FULL_41_23]OGH76637.1 MAG: hypothetical protein A3F22_01520 [Candidatus Magasanikbacteria bacterium RIFCSPHIGHO2_12_FULL_41_16]OGH78794.1 MAG: hypothetical protein A2983_00425 [Candidatus Magasanikbacteria bacterium RIFCSPLOWO2_01_FULL_40_15]
MYSKIFEELGLTKNEAKLYETLLSTGDISVSQLSVKADIHRRSIYDALNRLTQKGLVSPIFQKGENRYQAVHPDKLLEVVKERENKLNLILPDLRKNYNKTLAEEAAYIYKGPEGFKNYVREVMRIREDAYSLGAKGLLYSLSPGLTKELWQLVKKYKIDFYTLYDPRVKKFLPEVIAKEGGKKKVLPPEYATSGVLDIFGDRVVTFANVEVGRVFDDTTIFVMVNRQLAESYKIWYKLIWDSVKD